MAHIDAEALTTFEVTSDGERLQLNGEDAAGGAVSLSLSADCLSQMVMTLPRMAQTALRRRHGDDTLRLVYPAGGWSIEQGQGRAQTFILTMTTADGFEVSFSLTGEALAGLERSLQDAKAAPQAAAAIN